MGGEERFQRAALRVSVTENTVRFGDAVLRFLVEHTARLDPKRRLELAQGASRVPQVLQPKRARGDARDV